MKVFWSWQSDTPGKIGRHFVRDTLRDAIKELRQPEDIEEPSEREAREALHLDHDREGVSGSPGLAATIFDKIAQAAVFVADVTLVAEIPAKAGEGPKHLINSNVAIEYGYAVRALGDGLILMVQNTYYGSREDLPFDLKYKAGPIQYELAPKATAGQISAERTKLKQVLKDALQLCLRQPRASGAPRFEEIPLTTSRAAFWEPTDVLCRLSHSGFRQDERTDYHFAEQNVVYLRLIPTSALPTQLGVTQLLDIVQRRRLEILTRTIGSGVPDRNQFGAIAFEPHGTSTTPVGFSQLFRNGEIWGVTREMIIQYQGMQVIPMENVRNICARVLNNFVSVARDELEVPGPYTVEIGAVGLRNVRVSKPQSTMRWANDVSDPIYEDVAFLRRVLNDTSQQAQQALIEEFIATLYDLAGLST